MPRPYRRRFRRSTYRPNRNKRRSYRRTHKKGPGSATTSLTSRYGPIPKFLNTKLHFTAVWTSAAVAPANWTTVAMNNLTDPGLASSTKTPIYFNDLMTMYARYCVHASKIRLDGTSQTDVTSTGDGVIGCFPCVSAAQFGNVTDVLSAMSQPGSKSAIAARYANIVTRIKNYCKIKTLMGLHDVQDNPAFVGQSSAAPTEAPVWGLFAGSQNGASNYGYSVMVRMTYYVTLFRRDNENQP